MILRPVAVPPVKAILSTRGLAARACPTVGPGPSRSCALPAPPASRPVRGAERAWVARAGGPAPPGALVGLFAGRAMGHCRVAPGAVRRCGCGAIVGWIKDFSSAAFNREAPPRTHGYTP